MHNEKIFTEKFKSLYRDDETANAHPVNYFYLINFHQHRRDFLSALNFQTFYEFSMKILYANAVEMERYIKKKSCFILMKINLLLLHVF